MKRYVCSVVLLLIATLTYAQIPLSYYLPDDTQYDPNVPTPESVFGWQIGKWHVSHDKIVMYMQALAASSDRVTLEEYARSHEDRPLVVATITTPANHKNISQIKADHVALTDPSASASLKTGDMPVVLYQGYSVHGNESSGANAALLYAYYLAAAQGKEIEQALSNTIVLLDPCFNPDGLNRFASWANSHKSKTPMSGIDTREHQEAWPRGRTNHYWFDLNRDWLLVQHPESRGRIAKFHEWKPNVLTDHHEMGRNSTFFFQPGIPSRTNPLTPQKNQDLTAKIAEYHAKALDDIGSLYYTKESFDDFYYGKGSTYPDANGCIGILFEQASSRGHLQESVNGDLSFPFTVKNQLVTSISTFEAGQNLRKELLDFQRDFYKNNARKANAGAYIFGDEHDANRTLHLVDLIRRHDINVYENTRDIQQGGYNFKKGNSYIVQLQQDQSLLIEAMFEQRTTFTDSLFYDISAWTLPLAFNVPFSKITAVGSAAKEPVKEIIFAEKDIIGGRSDYAYLIDWNDYHAPRVLGQLLEKGLMAKVATKPCEALCSTGNMYKFDYGTILIPVEQQEMTSDELYTLMQKTAAENSVSIYGVATGMAASGIDMGSPSFSSLRKPNALLLVGDGVNAYDAGEVWHLLDNRFDIPVSVVDVKRANSLNMSKYNTLIMVDGKYSSLPVAKIRTWLNSGGTIVAMKGANRWLKTHQLAGLEFKQTTKAKQKRPYASLSNDSGAQYIGGNIMEAKLDLTHPIAYGYQREQLPVFRRGTLFFKPTNNTYASPLSYTSNPLMAGYISKENLKTAGGAPTVVVSRIGKGRVVSLSDNPNFRAFWYGTNKLFLNSIFFGHIIDSGATEAIATEEEDEEENEALEHGHKH